jgi:hypothetical protein
VIDRESIIQQSVQDYFRHQVFDVRGYPADKVELLDEFPYNRWDMEKLDKTYIAVGFNFDDGGRQGEMGSDLRERQYNIEFFVFGTTSVWGRNIANVVKFSLEQDGNIPLKDYTTSGHPVFDAVVLDEVSSEKIPVQDPRPWQENTWVVRLRVTDTYYASAA